MIEEAVVEPGGVAPTHPVLCAPASIAAAAESVLASSGASLSLAQVREAYLALHAAASAVEAARLHVVRMLVAHEVPRRRKAPGVQTKNWLEHTARLGSAAARTEVMAARATDPDVGALRGLGAALAAGEITRQHVEVATRLIPRLPEKTLERRGDEIEERLLDHARTFAPADADKLVKHLRRTLASTPGGLEDDLPEPPAAAHERRQCSWSTDWTGMTHIRLSLPHAEALPISAALSALAAPTRNSSGGPGGSDDDGAASPVDDRTTTQRRADAATELYHRGIATTGEVEREATRLVVVATEPQLADEPGAGGAVCTHDSSPLTPHALQRHACDAVVDRVVLDRKGAVMQMESVGRLANRAQRRALAARDGGCAFPACSAPASWCEAHHVVFWSQGGPTTVANLVLLCSRHHTEVHLGHWTITMRDEVPWFVPPAWVDPERRPVRNSFHQHITAARAFGADLGREPPDDPPHSPSSAEEAA